MSEALHQTRPEALTWVAKSQASHIHCTGLQNASGAQTLEMQLQPSGGVDDPAGHFNQNDQIVHWSFKSVQTIIHARKILCFCGSSNALLMPLVEREHHLG